MIILDHLWLNISIKKSIRKPSLPFLKKTCHFPSKKLNIPKEGVKRGQPLRHNPDPSSEPISQGCMKTQWFPLIRPAIKLNPYQSAGGRLTSHNLFIDDLKRYWVLLSVVSGWWAQHGICSLCFEGHPQCDIFGTATEASTSQNAVVLTLGTSCLWMYHFGSSAFGLVSLIIVEKQNDKVCWLLDILTSTISGMFRSHQLVWVANLKIQPKDNQQQWTTNNQQSIY